MNQEQSYEDNKADFIARLRAAGWDKKEAEAEWESIQNDREGTP
jgi:hypothetical protein